MRCRLRTLLILLAVVPPLLAFVWIAAGLLWSDFRMVRERIRFVRSNADPTATALPYVPDQPDPPDEN